MFYQVSGEGVVWAIVGGAGTLFGPIIGTTLFIIIREVVSTHWEHHSLIVGVMAILVVILAPKGLVGLWRAALDRFEHDRRGNAGAPNIAGRAMSAPMLETRNLTRRFGGLTAVDNLSLRLPGGKLHAIIGPNGAGKTTLFNLISGLLRPDAGAGAVPRPRHHRPASARNQPARHQANPAGQKRICPADASRKISGLPSRARTAFCIRFAMPRATAPHASASSRRSNRSG